MLEVIVRGDGCASQIRIVRSLDAGGLDEEAVAAVAQWRFEPGRLGAAPVDVLVAIVLHFRFAESCEAASQGFQFVVERERERVRNFPQVRAKITDGLPASPFAWRRLALILPFAAATQSAAVLQV